MDLTSLLSTMLSVDSVGSISQTAGVSIGEAQSVLGSALPSLLNGALEQSKGDDTAAGFDNALAQHAADDTSNVASFFSKVDLTDGSKIISHLLGGDGQAVSSISMKAGVSQKGTANILSAAAPLLMSLLGNAHYALVKKAQREKYQPELSLKLSSEGGKYIIKIHDNGIGIEDTIIDKVFDPFFTTKTTGEAAGVGLYLSREIVQNHGGDITIQSVKNEYCEVTLTLPALKR